MKRVLGFCFEVYYNLEAEAERKQTGDVIPRLVEILIVCFRYLLNTPESEYESQHSVRLMFGNGLRPEIWTDFVERYVLVSNVRYIGTSNKFFQVIPVFSFYSILWIRIRDPDPQSC